MDEADEFRKKVDTVERIREQDKFRTNARDQVIKHHFYKYLLDLSKEEIEDTDDKFLKSSKFFARVWYKEIVDKLYESIEDERK